VRGESICRVHLEAHHESDQSVAIGRRQRHQALFDFLSLAAVPEHGLEHVLGSPIVEQAGVAIDGFVETDAPKRRGAPLGSTWYGVGFFAQRDAAVVREVFACTW